MEAATQNPPFRYTTVRDGATEATLAKNYPEMNEYMNVSTIAKMLVQCLWDDPRYFDKEMPKKTHKNRNDQLTLFRLSPFTIHHLYDQKEISSIKLF